VRLRGFIAIVVVVKTTRGYTAGPFDPNEIIFKIEYNITIPKPIQRPREWLIVRKDI
jgi:hypothetical protein